MDTLKREIYMEAARWLERPAGNALCACLRAAMQDITGYRPRSDEMEEFFPEFAALADWKEWASAGHVAETYTDREGYPLAAYWWEPRWQAPRIRLVQTLLGDIR